MGLLGGQHVEKGDTFLKICEAAIPIRFHKFEIFTFQVTLNNYHHDI